MLGVVTFGIWLEDIGISKVCKGNYLSQVPRRGGGWDHFFSSQRWQKFMKPKSHKTGPLGSYRESLMIAVHLQSRNSLNCWNYVRLILPQRLHPHKHFSPETQCREGSIKSFYVGWKTRKGLVHVLVKLAFLPSMWNLIKGMCEFYHIACHCYCTPAASVRIFSHPLPCSVISKQVSNPHFLHRHKE